MENESEQRVYLGECGCVRIESKHFRLTMQPAEFVEILREIVRKQTTKQPFSNRLKISNNVRNSSGFVRIESKKETK